MAMTPRDPINQACIDAAKEMPGAKADQSDGRSPDSEAVKTAQQPTQGTPLAPSRLPGYRK